MAKMKNDGFSSAKMKTANKMATAAVAKKANDGYTSAQVKTVKKVAAMAPAKKSAITKMKK